MSHGAGVVLVSLVARSPRPPKGLPAVVVLESHPVKTAIKRNECVSAHTWAVFVHTRSTIDLLGACHREVDESSVKKKRRVRILSEKSTTRLEKILAGPRCRIVKKIRRHKPKRD
jgi:hypothetical protein